MSPDEPMPVLPTIDKRASARTSVPSKALEPTESDRIRALENTIGAKHLRDLSAMLQQKIQRKVVTMHTRYGQPPGDLGYIEAKDWNPDQQAQAAAWLANEQSKEWWRAQGEAQKASA